MRIDLLGLEAFLAIADHGSFNRAAARLGITQTALSHRLKKLETYLGTTLLHRTTRQMSLTPAGVDLLPRARALIDSAQRTFASLHAEAAVRQRQLAIGCLPTLAIDMLPRALVEFTRAHPHTEVRIFDNSASEIAERVQKGEAEFGVTILATKRWDLDLQPLFTEPYVLVCPSSHPIARRASVRWADLAGHSLIRIAVQTGNRVLIDEAIGAAGEHLSWAYEVQHIASAVALVAAGLGATIVPRSAVDVVGARHLSAVPLRGPGVSRTVGIVTRRGVPASPVAAALIAAIVRGAKSTPRKRSGPLARD